MKNFAEKLRTRILMEMNKEDLSIEIQDVTKNNNASYTGLVFKVEKDDIAPVIYVNDFYDQYINGREIEDITQNIINVYIKSLDQKPLNPYDLLDYEKIKNQLFVSAVNTERNAEMLKNTPHTECGDVSCIVRIEVNSDTNGIATVKVDNNIIKALGISEEELFNQAWKSMKNLHPAIVKDMVDITKEMPGFPDFMLDMMEERIGEMKEMPDFLNFMLDMMEERRGEMYVLQTDNKLNAAAYGYDKDTLNGVCEKVNSVEIYILPSSINEVIILPGNRVDNPDILPSIVSQVNDESVPYEEVLSDNIYSYNAITHEFSVISKIDINKDVWYDEEQDIEEDDDLEI